MRLGGLLLVGGVLVWLAGACSSDSSDTDGSGGASAGSGGVNRDAAGDSSAGTAGQDASDASDSAPEAAESDADANATSDSPTGAVIASGQARPTGIALTDSDVYWANEGNGTIVRCAQSGCGTNSPAVVVEGQAQLRGIAIYGSRLYWESFDVSDASTPTVSRKCTLPACNDIELAEPQASAGFGAFGVAVGPTGVYIAAHIYLRTCPLTGCPDASVNDLLTGGGIRGVALGADRVYFSRIGYRSVASCPLEHCADPADVKVLVPGVVWPFAVAVDAQHIYWSQYDYTLETPNGSSIRACPLTGCALNDAQVLASGASFGPFGLAVDATYLYYTDRVNGIVMRAPKGSSGGSCVAEHLTPCGSCPGGVVRCNGTCSCDAVQDAGHD